MTEHALGGKCSQETRTECAIGHMLYNKNEESRKTEEKITEVTFTTCPLQTQIKTEF